MDPGQFFMALQIAQVTFSIVVTLVTSAVGAVTWLRARRERETLAHLKTLTAMVAGQQQHQQAARTRRGQSPRTRSRYRYDEPSRSWIRLDDLPPPQDP